MSLFRLATKANVGTAQLYRVCRGEVAASAEWLARIASALGVEVGDLLGGLDSSENVRTVSGRRITMDPNLKETTFQIRLSPLDRAKLDAVADASSLSAAGLIRSLVAREARALGIVVEPTAKPAKRRGRK